MVGLLFARQRGPAEQQHSRLIGHRKLRKVAGVGAGGFEDEAELIAKAERESDRYHKLREEHIRARAKEEDHAEQSF